MNKNLNLYLLEYVRIPICTRISIYFERYVMEGAEIGIRLMGLIWANANIFKRVGEERSQK